MNNKKYFVYLLQSTSETTYVGATVDLERRLRQHNGELVGGAKATKTKVKKGENWKRVCYISEFPTWQSALQFEWRWKRISSKISKKMSPLERRLKALRTLLSLESSTTKAVPFSEWNIPPKINIELEDAKNIWNNYEVIN